MIEWPEGKQFAFTIFDDTDSTTLDAGRRVYDFLAECGLRTTKSVWPTRGSGTPSDHGTTCEDADYRRWAQSLQQEGFEIGYHMATSHTSTREETIRGLQRFAEYFGAPPKCMANHYFSNENIYFGDARVTGMNRLVYNLLTRFQHHNRFRGHVPGDPLFWGDLCQQQVKFVRNFAFADINTLKACPLMPYHDPTRPFVNYWFACSEGKEAPGFNQTLTEANQDRLESEGGACIIYTHFGLGFANNRELNPRFQALVRRLSEKKGWFVPVSDLLEYIIAARGPVTVTPSQRQQLERRWLMHKICYGTA